MFELVINNEPILSSMLAAGIVQVRLLEKLGKVSEGGEVEMTGGYFYHPAPKFFPFEFLSQITNTRMRIRNVCTYTYILL